MEKIDTAAPKQIFLSLQVELLQKGFQKQTQRAPDEKLTDF